MKKFFAIAAICAALFASCVKQDEMSGEKMENISLKAWMKKHHPELLGNYQELDNPDTDAKETMGEFYIDVIEWGYMLTPSNGNDLGGEPIMNQDTCWIYYNYTGRDLTGNVCVTRTEDIARMQNTYLDVTHYVPYGIYCGIDNYYGLVEGTYLAGRHKIKLDEKYVADKGFPSTEFLLRKGSKVRLYLPSRVGFGATGSDAEGGYEGQFVLDANRPVIMDIEVMRVFKNPSDCELDMVETLVKESNVRAGSDIWKKIVKDEDDEKLESEEGKTDGTFTGLYYTTDYKPGDERTALGYMQPHKDGTNNPYKDSDRYADMSTLNADIAKILNDKFADMTLEEGAEPKAVGEKTTVNVWYVGTFLDGFVFDTNIPEVKEYLFGSKSGKAISYNAENDKDDYISAWYRCIPLMHFGKWGAIITTSGYGYGADGKVGDTSTVAYPAYAYFYNYSNAYYYNDYYGYPVDYYGGMSGGNIGSSDGEDDGSSEDEARTEIMAYTPLIFYVFIEQNEVSED